MKFMNRAHAKFGAGDDGTTSLADGKRVKKTSERIELYGEIDELNVHLGHAAEVLCGNQNFTNLLQQVYRIQKELLELGSCLVSGKKFVVEPYRVNKLEIEIDALSERLPILHSSVLPGGGGEGASRIYLARAVCRRAERTAFKLIATDKGAEIIGIYLNRLSDWLYVAARTAAFIANAEEMPIYSS